MDEPAWLEWAKKLQEISQAGLEYSVDVFDRERFEQICEISREIMTNYTEASKEKISDLFTNETGYATPKVDVRAVVFKEGKILLVKEKLDKSWALPGGWADIGLSPSENAVKETKEEVGYDVKPVKVIAVMDKLKHAHPRSPYQIYKFFILCEIIEEGLPDGIETSEVAFFSENNLPKLSVARNTENQIRSAFKHLKDPKRSIYFD